MNRLARALLPKRHFSAPVRFAGVTFIVLAAWLSRSLFAPAFASYRHELFFPAVLISAVLFDHWAGFLATFLCALLSNLYLPSVGPVLTGDRAVALGVFVPVGLLMTLILEGLRHALRELASAKEEKELLLRELIHRTRNDLFVVASIISLQARNERDPAAKQALHSAVARISSVGQVQERLHATGAPKGRVPLSRYLHSLCEQLAQMLDGVRPVAFQVDAPPTEIDPSAAASIGLIVNELVTNALKYAFTDQASGLVEVTAWHQDDATHILVKDNGSGCPVDAQPGTGSRLVSDLAARLGGVMTRTSDASGCRVEVILPTLSLTSAK